MDTDYFDGYTDAGFKIFYSGVKSSRNTYPKSYGTSSLPLTASTARAPQSLYTTTKITESTHFS
jgi:hypothetical protein